jgi:hypothetical protein
MGHDDMSDAEMKKYLEDTREQVWDAGMTHAAAHYSLQAELAVKSARHDLLQARNDSAHRKLKIIMEHSEGSEITAALSEVMSTLRGSEND